MSDEMFSLKANSILLANASSNLANFNTTDYKSIRTSLVEGRNGGLSVLTERTTEKGSFTSDGHETSNVDIAKELTDITRAKRGYEAALKSIETMDDTLNSLMELLKDHTEN